jgi:hypothetical protein
MGRGQGPAAGGFLAGPLPGEPNCGAISFLPVTFMDGRSFQVGTQTTSASPAKPRATAPSLPCLQVCPDTRTRGHGVLQSSLLLDKNHIGFHPPASYPSSPAGSIPRKRAATARLPACLPTPCCASTAAILESFRFISFTFPGEMDVSYLAIIILTNLTANWSYRAYSWQPHCHFQWFYPEWPEKLRRVL